MEKQFKKASESAFKMIRQFEGLRLRAYKPLPFEPNFTIGYGHCAPDVSKGQIITKERAEELLQEDVLEFEQHVNDNYPNLTQNQFDSVISMMYNLGWRTFEHNPIHDYMKECNKRRTPLECACKMVLYCYAGGKRILGLQQRRVVEANHFLGYKHFVIRCKKIVELPNSK